MKTLYKVFWADGGIASFMAMPPHYTLYSVGTEMKALHYYGVPFPFFAFDTLQHAADYAYQITPLLHIRDSGSMQIWEVESQSNLPVRFIPDLYATEYWENLWYQFWNDQAEERYFRNRGGYVVAPLGTVLCFDLTLTRQMV